jgi:4-amino-4-deoxy-L-arabinose transferase-like glycosyltransferase
MPGTQNSSNTAHGADQRVQPDNGDRIVTRKPDRIEALSRRFVLHLLWAGAGVVALVAQFGRVFDGLQLSGAMDLAQLGRHLAAGHGYVTSFLRPIEVALYPQVPAPEIYTAPLYPLLLALSFGALPLTDAVVAGVSALFFLATLVLVYLLGAKMFDRASGILGAVLFAVSTQAAAYAVSGLHLTLWAFLLLLTIYLLYTDRESAKRTLVAGAVFGLCWLTEYMTWALIVPVLVAAYLLHGDRRLRHLGWFAAGLVVVMIPWWVRNAIVTGDPFFTLERYLVAVLPATHPGYTLFRSTDVSALNLPALIAAEPRQIIRKEIVGLVSAYRAIPMLVGLWVIGFFVAAAMRRLPDARENAMRGTVFLLVAFLAVIGAAHNPSAELFFVLVPPLLVLCGGYFVMLMREWIAPLRGRIIAVAVFVAIAAYPTVVSWITPQPRAGVTDINLAYLKQALPSQAVVVTDVPWAVAWYADRPAVWLPLTSDDFDAVSRRIGVDAVYFSTLLQTYPGTERALMWQQMYAARVPPPGFTPSDLPQPEEALFVRAPRPADLRTRR